MATIKKACKGVSYPKASNVSGRLGSISKAKTGKLVPSSSSVSKRLGTIKKAEKGTSLGMKSVKAGIDKNPGVTRADIIAAATKQAKKGKMVKKAAPKKAMMAKAPMQQSSPMSAPMMKKGGKMKKCSHGCK